LRLRRPQVRIDVLNATKLTTLLIDQNVHLLGLDLTIDQRVFRFKQVHGFWSVMKSQFN